MNKVDGIVRKKRKKWVAIILFIFIFKAAVHKIIHILQKWLNDKNIFSEGELTALFSYRHPNYAVMRQRNRSLTET